MDDRSSAVLRDFQSYLDRMAAGLAGVERWAHYPDRKHRDNGLQHTFQTAFLAISMLAVERDEGNANDLDAERIIAAAVTHDIGEWLLGDIRYQVKNDPRVAEELRKIETELYEREILGPLPPAISRALARASALQDDRESRSGQFFNAVERIGYILFAIREYREGDHTLALDVFRRQHESLEAFREEFAAVRKFYDPIRQEIEEAVSAVVG